MDFLPRGLLEWTIVGFGLLLISLRVVGTWKPRPWVEWLERRFTYSTQLQALGALLVIAACGLAYMVYAQPPPLNIITILFAFALEIFFITGVGLLAFQNHMRHLAIGTAEWSDLKVQVFCIANVLVGVVFVLATLFF